MPRRWNTRATGPRIDGPWAACKSEGTWNTKLPGPAEWFPDHRLNAGDLCYRLLTTRSPRLLVHIDSFNKPIPPPLTTRRRLRVFSVAATGQSYVNRIWNRRVEVEATAASDSSRYPGNGIEMNLSKF